MFGFGRLPSSRQGSMPTSVFNYPPSGSSQEGCGKQLSFLPPMAQEGCGRLSFLGESPSPALREAKKPAATLVGTMGFGKCALPPAPTGLPKRAGRSTCLPCPTLEQSMELSELNQRNPSVLNW